MHISAGEATGLDSIGSQQNFSENFLRRCWVSEKTGLKYRTRQTNLVGYTFSSYQKTIFDNSLCERADACSKSSLCARKCKILILWIYFKTAMKSYRIAVTSTFTILAYAFFPNIKLALLWKCGGTNVTEAVSPRKTLPQNCVHSNIFNFSTG